jgi:hypothetical protein
VLGNSEKRSVATGPHASQYLAYCQHVNSINISIKRQLGVHSRWLVVSTAVNSWNGYLMAFDSAISIEKI